MIELTGLDMFVRHTDTKGKTVVICHRVWDKERFLSARRDECAKENAKQKAGEPRFAKVEQITQDQYLKERSK